MAQGKVDWSVLRGAAGLFGICFLLSAMLLAASHYFREEMQLQYSRYHAKFRDASRNYLAVDQEEQIIRQHYPDFVRLYRKGVIGAEQRLNWLETLKTAVDTIQLPEMNYKIESRTVYEPDFSVNLGAYDLYASDMWLSLGLLHEGDLTRLIGALDRAAAGLYTVDQCKMSRTEKKPVLDGKTANIQADCKLRWFTLDLKGDRKVTL